MHTFAPKQAAAPQIESVSPRSRKGPAGTPTQHAARPGLPVNHTAVPPCLGDVLVAPGAPLDPALRAHAEAHLGFDFARVRVHADPAAAQAAEAVRARAFTVGAHIAFAGGHYQPRTPAGRRLLLHELVHVAQQGPTADPAPMPRSMTDPHDASEREARALVSRSEAGAPPPHLFSTLGPAVARFDVEGARQQQERSEALRQGRDPDAPVSEPPDPLEEALREARRNPPPRPPEPTLPGDPVQQARTIARVDPADLFAQPRIQDQIKRLATETEARERKTLQPGGQLKHSAEHMTAYWRARFIASVDYILYRRGGSRRDKLLRQLRAEEAKLVKAAPADLDAQVEALRRTFGDRWQQEVDRTVERFVTLASNQAQFLTVKQAATPVAIYGLPEELEGTVEASAHPGTVAKGSTPVAPSVVEFMKAVQQESGLKAKADNYPEHEKHSPYLGDVAGVGKYSFDVDLGGLIKVNAEGFYEREPLIKFFLAVDRAASASGIAWVALYNDFAVAKAVNEKLGKRRIGFAGGGSAGPGREGSIHHGPAPYVLHIHFNIMPKVLAGQYVAGKATLPYIDLSE
jgi:hypothetical protein